MGEIHCFESVRQNQADMSNRPYVNMRRPGTGSVVLPDAMQGVRFAAVRALQGTDNAAARRSTLETSTVCFVRVLGVASQVDLRRSRQAPPHISPMTTAGCRDSFGIQPTHV
jgi:hypothetical protein